MCASVRACVRHFVVHVCTHGVYTHMCMHACVRVCVVALQHGFAIVRARVSLCVRVGVRVRQACVAVGEWRVHAMAAMRWSRHTRRRRMPSPRKCRPRPRLPTTRTPTRAHAAHPASEPLPGPRRHKGLLVLPCSVPGNPKPPALANSQPHHTHTPHSSWIPPRRGRPPCPFQPYFYYSPPRRPAGAAPPPA